MEAQSTVYKAVVLKRFWSHNQSRRAKEWAFKRKLIVCVCFGAEEEENGEGQFRVRVRSCGGKWKKRVRRKRETVKRAIIAR